MRQESRASLRGCSFVWGGMTTLDPLTPEAAAVPRVAILLATYNGARCLQAQLDSYATQTHPPVAIVISDDGSQDETRQIVEAFAAAHPELGVRLIAGPQRGAAQNFLHLLRQAPGDVDIVALSDQDDVWLPGKLSRGVAYLHQAEQERAEQERAEQEQAEPNWAGATPPVLYCGRSWECDDDLGNRRLSRGMPKPASFRHALVQNVAGGNTMMVNRSALDVLRGASQEVGKLVVHDWWIYQILMGCGAELVFDNSPMLLYRQHSDNLIGANRGLRAKYIRLRMLFSGRFRAWNTVNIKALSASSHRFSTENQHLLQRFARDRNGPVWRRLWMVYANGFYRQGLQGTLSLYLAALMRRI